MKKTATKSQDAKKSDDGKLRYDLIPAYPLAMLAHIYTMGASKYGDHNWRKGMSWGRLFAAMMRHAWDWWWGQDNDEESRVSHLAHVAWGAFALMEYQMRKLGTDDRIPQPDDL